MTIYNNPTIKVKLRNSTTLSVPLPAFVNINAVNIIATNAVSIGNGSVNTQINSTSVSLRSLRANGSFGTSGQVLTTNGTGVYWSTVSGGGGGGSFSNGIAYIWSDIQTFEANVIVSNSVLSVGNSSVNVTTNTTHIIVGNSSVNVSINSTAFSGTANNATNLGGISAASYQTTTGLAANVATLTANNSTNLNGQNSSFYTNATNITTGTLAEPRLPFRMNQNVQTTDSVVFGSATISGNLTVLGSSIVIQGNTTTFVDNMLYLNQGISANISNIITNGSQIRFVANNNYQAGWDVAVIGVNPSSYNTTYLNIVSANSTEFVVTGTNVDPYVSGGIARGKSESNPDLGLAAGYNDGSYHHTGIFRDATDGYWKVFEGYDPEPDASIYIDTSDSSFTIANFWTNSVRLGNTTVYATANSTQFSGTANNATNFNGQNSSFYANATNITTGTIAAARLAISGTPDSTTYLRGDQTWAGLTPTLPGGVDTQVQFNDGGIFGGNNLFVFAKATSRLTIGNNTVNTAVLPASILVSNSTSQISVNTGVILVGNASVNVSINSTAFSGTANNATNLGGVAASGYQTTAGLSANVATLTSNNSLNLGGVAAANYVNTSGNYTITGIHTMNANLFVNNAILSVGNTTANVFANTTHIFVGNTLTSVTINSTAFSGTANNATNLGGTAASGYQTTAGLAANVATLTSNNTNNLGGVAAANYVNTSGNYTITGIHTLNANLFINTANHLLIGNGSVNAVANQTTLAIFNGTTNTSITPGTITFGGGSTVNNTIYSGTANNATNFNGQPASFYANATNLTTGLVNTAQLATSGTPSSTTFLRGDRQWVTVSGGTTNPAGSNTEIQFNDSGVFGANNRFLFDRASTTLTVGDGTNNTQINSTSVVLRTLIANSQVGTSGQVLTSAGSGANVYWQTLSAFSTSTPYVFTAVQTFNANVFVNTATLSIGNTTANVFANTTHIFVGNTLTSVTINSTAFSGTANNATNLGGVAASGYQTTAGLSANVATLTSNNSLNLGGELPAFYTNATNISTGTLNHARLPANAVFWSNNNSYTAIQTFNANVFVNTATLSVGNTTANVTVNTTVLSIGNTSVNTVVNSTALVLKSLIANGSIGGIGELLASNGTGLYWTSPPSGSFSNGTAYTWSAPQTFQANVVLQDRLSANGSFGSAGQVLTSAGTGSNVYWATPTGGGGGGSNETVSTVSVNTTLAAPTTFYIASGTITLTLPTAVGNSGLRFWIKNNGTGEITVLPQSGQTINGYINMIITEQNSVMGLVSDGSNWNVY